MAQPFWGFSKDENRWQHNLSAIVAILSTASTDIYIIKAQQHLWKNLSSLMMPYFPLKMNHHSRTCLLPLLVTCFNFFITHYIPELLHANPCPPHMPMLLLHHRNFFFTIWRHRLTEVSHVFCSKSTHTCCNTFPQLKWNTAWSIESPELSEDFQSLYMATLLP
jgi:hypothetical protein